MNDSMYKNRIVQKNIETLKNNGYKFIGPVRGKLASGKIGVGHLSPADEIVSKAKNLIK
jgi:phosphopantothenoylcysteine decarboxylase/phosphopantothenate--cysteine ligase